MKSNETQGLEQYRELHLTDKEWGASSHVKFNEVTAVINGLLESCFHSGRMFRVLDFGCGKSALVDHLALHYHSSTYTLEFVKYDPAIEALAAKPVGLFDLVINTDVLEHIYEEDLPNILGDMRSYSEHCYINVSTRLAYTYLPNGENAHVTVRPGRWWYEKLKIYWNHELYLYCSAEHEVTLCSLRPSISMRRKYVIKKVKWEVFMFARKIAILFGVKDTLKRLLKFKK